jgi:hypothetical protein
MGVLKRRVNNVGFSKVLDKGTTCSHSINK